MATVVLKKKMPALAVAPQAEEVDPLVQQIDLVGSQLPRVAKITKEIKALQDMLKPFKAEADKLQAMVDALEIDDDGEDVREGDRFRVEIGKRGSNRKVTSMAGIRDALGDELFMELATITLKNVDDYLTPPQKEKVLETTRTSRSIKLAARG